MCLRRGQLLFKRLNTSWTWFHNQVTDCSCPSGLCITTLINADLRNVYLLVGFFHPTDGACLFPAAVSCFHLWRHPRKRVVRGLHGERNPETELQIRWGGFSFYNHRHIEPTGCGSLQKIHRKRPQSLFHKRLAEVSWKRAFQKQD